MSILIAYLGNDEAIRFAAEELRAYFGKMEKGADVALLSAKKYDPARKGTIWLGMDEAFVEYLPKVEDPRLDDAIYLDVDGSAGIVTGTNPRSVLIAAYRLLRENGCAFVSPCEGGERVPEKELSSLSAHVAEAADCRHRGVCIEGAVGYEHVLNMIRFLPKIGMNTYFIQFFAPRVFFDRWYSHAYNSKYPSRTVSREETMEMKDALIGEIRRRGLLYHAIGHGWTCEPLGLASDAWEEYKGEVPEGAKRSFALVNGKRELWAGGPLDTQLCYGQESVRERMTDAIADYCEAHPEVDYLHFWLADGANNHCECELCRDTLPSDFYVDMLNRLDEKLTERGVPTKMVFLAYMDLLWVPERERIANPDRFALMFAPISRTYSRAFVPGGKFAGNLPEFVRNRNELPKSVEENVARLERWQAQFTGDGFDFDYHFMWDHLKDLGYYGIAQVLMEDMKNLKKLGLNGMVSCQNQRVFFPTALGMHAMAEGLWNNRADFETVAKRYFADAYGENGEAVRNYLSAVSEAWDAPYIRGEKPAVSAEQAEKYRSLITLVEKFFTETPMGEGIEWQYLKLHGDLISRLCVALALRAEGAFDAARRAWQEIREWVCGIEKDVHEGFDVMEFFYVYDTVFGT